MKKNNESRHQFESKVLVDFNVKKDLEILMDTISFLEEQAENYEQSMLVIRQQLEDDHIEYTYNSENNIVLQCNLIQDSRESSSQELQKLQETYNLLSNKAKRIRKNILDIKSNFIDRCTNSVRHTIVDEIGENGLCILNAQETERSRIACDLHDTVVQNLTSLIHKAELCIRTVDIDPIDVKLDLQLMIQHIRSIVDDIRAIIYNLRPMALEDLGLETAVRRYLDQFEQLNKVSTSFQFQCDNLKLNTSVLSITLFRIIQESCSNAVKHGHAKLIDISIIEGNDHVQLTIKDNGCGFDQKSSIVSERTDNSGFGLSIIKERVCLLAGQVKIDSYKNKGTIIQVKVPVKMC